MSYITIVALLGISVGAIDQEDKDPKKPEFKIIINGQIIGGSGGSEDQQKGDSLDKLIQDLKSGDNTRIEEAYRKLIDMLGRVQDSLNDSKEKFGSDEADLLKSFLNHVIKLRVKRFVKDLLSSDLKTKEKAVEELHFMGDEILGLLEQEKDNEEVKRVVESIKKTKEEVLKLIEDLGSEDAVKRQAAKEQLGKLGKKAKPYMKQFKNDGNAERKANVNALLEDLEKKDQTALKEDPKSGDGPKGIIIKRFIMKDGEFKEDK
jgi:nitrate reductase assembly molybdenum cofactor insertion protein NarJ